MTRVTASPVVVPLALLAAVVAAISGSRVWLAGRVVDPVLGNSAVTGTGTEVVPGLVALALVLAAAVLAAASAGPVVRRVCLSLGTVVAATLAVLAVRALATSAELLGGVAAEATSRSGRVPVTGVSVSVWPALVAALALLGVVACLAGLAGASSWRGLSQRYEAPQPGDVAGSRGERTPGAWDQLDRDIDPTDAP